MHRQSAFYLAGEDVTERGRVYFVTWRFWTATVTAMATIIAATTNHMIKLRVMSPIADQLQVISAASDAQRKSAARKTRRRSTMARQSRLILP